jgi:glycosyltransferase involved in cell wall biosynthesis
LTTVPVKPPRILVISEIPTPYRLPLYARLAERPEFELEVVFCAASEPDRPWKLDVALAGVPHRVLRGFAPSIRTRRGTFVYEVNPGAVRLLARSRYDAVVVGGYAVFAEQAAIAIARARGIPYLLHSESTLAKARAPWLRLAKRGLVGPTVRNAAAGLAVGSAAADYLVHYGLDRGRIRIVPNTIDVASYGRAAAGARSRAEEVRARWQLPAEFVLFAGRLVEDKGVRDLLDALRLLGDNAPALVVAGEGPLAGEFHALAGVHQVGFVQPEQLIELLALAAWTVVPSRVEPWGVIVNEALASGSPVIATAAVGAARDLVVDGSNGRVVPARDPEALADALAGPRPQGDPSEGRIAGWDYDFAVDQFVDALRVALPGRLPPR